MAFENTPLRVGLFGGRNGGLCCGLGGSLGLVTSGLTLSFGNCGAVGLLFPLGSLLLSN